MPPLPVPWCDALCQPGRSVHAWLVMVYSEKLDCDHTKALHPTLMGEEHCHGEHPHPE
jgi:hypothetical protein